MTRLGRIIPKGLVMEFSFEGIEGLSEDQKAALSEKITAANAADVAGLKSKNSELIEKNKLGNAAAEELERTSALAAEKLATAQGNFDEAQRLATERMDKERLASSAREDGYKGQLSDLYVTQAKTGLATEIANTTEDIPVLEMFLQKHITMKDVDGKMQTDYGEAGSREALIESFKKDPSMARFISGTKATGVGAKGANGNGKASVTNKPFSEMNMTEKKSYMDSKQ